MDRVTLRDMLISTWIDSVGKTQPDLTERLVKIHNQKQAVLQAEETAKTGGEDA